MTKVVVERLRNALCADWDSCRMFCEQLIAANPIQYDPLNWLLSSQSTVVGRSWKIYFVSAVFSTKLTGFSVVYTVLA